MRDVTVTTSTQGIEYPVTLQQFESVNEAVDAIDGGEEGVLEILNSAQEQDAKQNAKGPVREAAEAALEAGVDESTLQSVVDGEIPPEQTTAPEAAQELLQAIEDHRENAAEFIKGRPRGRAGGVTKTASRELGERIREKADGDPEQMREIADSLGIDADDLF